MKISFDLDDTLLKYPNQLFLFGIFMQQLGHEVGILSGQAVWAIEQNILPFCQMYGFKPDFYIGANNEGTDPGPEVTQEVKDREWKPGKIRDNHIDIHFDNAADLMEGQEMGGAKILKI